MTPADVKNLRAIVQRARLQVEAAMVYSNGRALTLALNEMVEAERILGRAVVEVLTDADRAQAADASGRN